MRHQFWVGFVSAIIISFAGSVIQLLVGPNADFSAWSYPYNLLVFIAIFLCALVLKNKFYKTSLYRIVKSVQFSGGVITFAIGLLLIMGLLAQKQPDFNNTSSIFSYIVSSMVYSWPFVLMVALLMFLLSLTIIGRRASFSARYLSFLFNHVGLLLVLAAGLLGAPDKEESRTMMSPGSKTSEAYTSNGRRVKLPFEMELSQMSSPQYIATLALIDNETPEREERSLSVNNPCFHRGYHIYLYHYEYQNGVTLHIIKDRWWWLWIVGLYMMIAGAAIMFVMGPIGFVYKHDGGDSSVQTINEMES